MSADPAPPPDPDGLPTPRLLAWLDRRADQGLAEVRDLLAGLPPEARKQLGLAIAAMTRSPDLPTVFVGVCASLGFSLAVNAAVQARAAEGPGGAPTRRDGPDDGVGGGEQGGETP